MKAGPRSWNNSRKSIAFRFLRYYAIVLLVPVVMSAVVNRMLFGTLRDTATQNSGAVAQYVTEKLDLQLADIRNYAIDLSVNVQLRGYLFSSGTKDGDVDVIALRRVIEQLPDWNTATGIIEALHVYCNNINTILTSSTAYLRMEAMYGHFFGRPDMDWGTW
ncbi:MAG TPA: hypothetical protein PKE04_02660, partial [Clostridia bacterium]|nr:hypothetical protein [Clostridia bacterium]